MILSSQLLDTYDRCPRRYAFEREYELRSISPLGLLYAGVEASMTSGDPEQAARDAVLERAAYMDIIAGEISSLSVVNHVKAMAEVIALVLRSRLGQGTRPEDVTVDEHTWKSNLFLLRTGLHRIVLCSHMDDDTLRAYAHSWGTIGEMAALKTSLTLTAIVIGAQRGGRRHSPWAKGLLHPVQKSLRFAPRKRDTGFTENWKTCWREQTDISSKTWLERMKTDDVLKDLIVSRKVQYRGDDERMAQARKDIMVLAEGQVRARTSDPMRRSSCDELGRGSCPFQAVCYSPTAMSPVDFPLLYRIREKPHAATEE